MEAKVQIMEVDRVNANGRLYPRSVVEEALRKLNGKPLAVIPVRAFLDSDGCPKVSDSLGVASALRIDDSTDHVIADVRIEKIPEDLQQGYVIRSAGTGKVDDQGVVSDFEFTGVVIARE